MQGVATLVGAAAVLVAAKMGADTFGSWRRQKVTERHIEQAERILTASYKARRALKRIRTPLVDGWEINAAEKELKTSHADEWDALPEAEQRRYASAQALLIRFNRSKDEKQALDSCLPMARALFGENLEAAIETLAQQFVNVAVYQQASMNDNGGDPAFEEEVRMGIYDIKLANKPNTISDAIETAIAAIETICLPSLQIDEQKPAQAKGKSD